AIDAAEHLELVMEPELSVILFKRDGWDLDQMLEWSEYHARTGVILCLPTRWHGESVYRLCIISPDTNPSRVVEALATMQ
ncbi:MAG: aspartate aminotransferase family protein, partial [Acidimicrobiales bacterium]